MPLKIDVVAKPLHEIASGALVILFAGKAPFHTPENEGLRYHVEGYARAIGTGASSREWFCTVDKSAGAKTSHLLLDAADRGDWLPGAELLKCAAARAVELCRAHSIVKIAFAFDANDTVARARAVLEGCVLGDFLDQRFKSSGKERKELALTFVVPKDVAAEVREAIEEHSPTLDGVNKARELVNAPNNILTPSDLMEEAARVARLGGMKMEILDGKKLQKLGYELLWNVGRGSEYPPALGVMKYAPRKTRIDTHVCLVGKGMTFDTGGLCLKSKDNIFLMNNDMGGAAAVIGAMHAIAAAELPVRVTAIIPSAHNAVDGAAYTPGCILKSKAGKTVYIENTDAEGRLILADAFARAAEEKPDVMVDLATLTGAAVIALGSKISALFTDDDGLRADLLASGEATGDALWHLPMWKEYEGQLRHDLADLNNMSSDKSGGGHIHAANFLKAFVPEGVRWAHLDIAGPAAYTRRVKYFAPGGTGVGVRLLTHWLKAGVDRGRL